MSFLIILIDKFNVENTFRFDTVSEALSYGRILSRNNQNAILLELVNTAKGGELLKKWR